MNATARADVAGQSADPTSQPSKMRVLGGKTVSATNKFLDATFGNVGFGFGYGAAMVATVPVAGAPVRAFNQGVAKGYQKARVQIMVGQIMKGEMTLADIEADLDLPTKQILQDAVSRAQDKTEVHEITSPSGAHPISRGHGGALDDFLEDVPQ